MAMRDHWPEQSFSLTDDFTCHGTMSIRQWPTPREFGHTLIVVFGVEMNGTGFHGRALLRRRTMGPREENWKGPERVRAAYRT